ncbi:MAG: class I SAM-dependent DNA methyltransferase [Bellilinea sp.]
MDVYAAETYGDKIAPVYDELYPGYDENAIHRLAELSRGGRALELGIGTGRFALPLQGMGVEVHGIDASQAMIDRLRAKPDGERIPVTVGDFSAVDVVGEFSLIYVVFNTLFGLLTQDAQIHCFENVARHLTPEGVFVVEAFVPDLKRFDNGQSLKVISLDEGALRLDASRIDVAHQTITAQHVHLSEQGTQIFPVKLRYIWPSEMDLMARLAGLHLRQRWGGWEQSPFTSSSGKHITLYGLAAPALS